MISMPYVGSLLSQKPIFQGCLQWQSGRWPGLFRISTSRALNQSGDRLKRFSPARFRQVLEILREREGFTREAVGE